MFGKETLSIYCLLSLSCIQVILRQKLNQGGQMANIQDIKVGVVGLGSHFKETLLPTLIGQKGVILSAFCDQSAERVQWVRPRFPQAVITDNLSGTDFWSAIDCVVCCSWPSVHEQVLKDAIDRGKHCFCEKPAASSATALGQILGKQRANGLVFRVGHTFRYMGGASRFIDLVANNDLMCLQVTYLGSGPNGSRWEMDQRRSFSLTHLTHAVDFVTASAGRVIEVRNVAWSIIGETDSLAASFMTERCKLVSLFATNSAQAFTFKASGVLASGALVHLDSLRNVTLTGETLEEKRSGSIWKERDLGIGLQNDGYMDEMAAFFDEIRGEGPCRLPNLEHAKHVLEVIERIEAE